MERKRIDYYPGIFDPYKTDMNMEHWTEAFDATPWKAPFHEVMWGLGFEMDRFESFLTSYPQFVSTRLSDPDVLRQVREILKESDAKMVGNFLFSFFRQKTHWDYICALSPEEEQFVMELFGLLENKLSQHIVD